MDIKQGPAPRRIPVRTVQLSYPNFSLFPFRAPPSEAKLNIPLNLPAPESRHPPSNRWVYGLGCGLVLFVGAIWLRNRDILGDLFDVSILIGAAGKVHAGLHPYTDVRSPVQSATFLLNALTESVFGRNYLGLTWGGLVQAWGGAGLIFWITKKQGGPTLAVAFTAALVLGGLIQHVVFFYNPIGIASAAIAIIGLSRCPDLDRLRQPTTWLIFGALIISGINKLNFHGFTLAVGATLLLLAKSKGELDWKRFLQQTALLGLAGLILPLVIELAWTGASLATWFDNVIALPAERLDSMARWSDPGLLLRPAAPYYHHLLFPYLGGLGFLAVGIATVWSMVAGRAHPQWPANVVRLILACGGLLGSCLLMVTNNETLSLTSLPCLIIAVALVLSSSTSNQPSPRLVAFATIACVPWIVNGGYSAWHGSRVHYGLHEPQRSEFQRLENAPLPLRYFEGVRFHPVKLSQLEALAGTLVGMESTQGKLPGVVFGPAAEWLERAYPDNIVRNMPVLFHHGVSLREGDLDWFAQNLSAAGADKILVQSEWENWPDDIATWLNTEFIPLPIANRYLLYQGISPALAPPHPNELTFSHPGEFRDQTHSNIDPRLTTGSPELAFQETTIGTVWGSDQSVTWDWEMHPFHLTGRWVVESQSPTPAGSVEMRITASGDGGYQSVLDRVTIPLNSDTPAQSSVFDIRPNGLKLKWEIIPSDDSTDFIAGWREIRILHSGNPQSRPTLPVNPRRSVLSETPGPTLAASSLFWFHNQPNEKPGIAYPAVPFELWFRPKPGVNHVRAHIELDRDSLGAANGPIFVSLCSYRDGRFEIAQGITILRSDTQISVEGWIPETGSWVVLMPRPSSPTETPLRISKITWEDLSEP